MRDGKGEGMSKGQSDDRVLRLAIWGKTMEAVWRRGWNWPGFDYSIPERQRLQTLAAAVGDIAPTIYNFAAAAIFLAITGLVILIILWGLDQLHIGSANVQPWMFQTALPLGVFLMLGAAMPFAIAR